MQDAFYMHAGKFDDWVMEGYPGVTQETRNFLGNLFRTDRKFKLWRHQERAILRTIYSYEVLDKRDILLNIVTGGGKTIIIAAVMAWLKTCHSVSKFLVLVPNLIVRDRLQVDFEGGRIFKKAELFPEEQSFLINELGLHVLQAGGTPQGMMESGVILANIQQFYTSNMAGQRNLHYVMTNIGEIVVFNDEAHNTPAPEYSNVLSTLSTKARFRLDTTATPDRADGQAPDSEMIYHYDISEALEDGIVKSIVVYEPEVKLLELTYTNFETREKKIVTELSEEFKQAEEGLKPFQWILDEEPMRKQMAIALQRLEEQKRRAKDRYKPILFVVTMSIREAERAQKMLEETFKVRALLVTEESDDDDREEARVIGTKESKYDAVVSVLMLREGWDVPEVSTILLLRKFSSQVYGQQVIGRGLRRIIREDNEPEILAVIDHPKLEHDWLWRLVAVSKIRQGVLPEDLFGDEDLPARPKIQKLVRPDKFIVIPDPLYETKLDLDKIAKEVPEDTVDLNWRQTLAAVIYDRNVWTITRTRVKQVRGKRLSDKRLELVEGPKGEIGPTGGVEMTREELEDQFKEEVKDVATGLLIEAGFGGMKKGQLYGAVMDHIRDKIFGGEVLSEASVDDIDFAMAIMEVIRKNFTKPVIAGILAS
ncbi:MAG: DEAD/DEAH box helicase family protein [Nitrososphaerota archaeon]|nr:DEAD/DEAH box helicase family protein [Nitrososphaerota archaeon]